MMSTARRLWCLMAVVCAVGLATVRAADKATVTTVNNVVASGDLLLDEYDKIVVKTAKGEQTIPANKVRTVKFSPMNANILSGDSKLRQRRYDGALEKYQAALEDKKKGKWVERYALYGIAKCQVKMAAEDPTKLPEAIKTFEKLLSKYPKFRYLPEVYLGLAEGYYIGKKYDKMANVIGKLDPKVFGDKWLVWKQLWGAKLLAAKGNYDEAEKQYAALAEQAEKERNRDLHDEAVFSRGACLLKLKKYPEGEDLLFKLGKDASSKAIRARVYNALGESFWSRGEYNEAHFSFLRVAVLYFDSPEEHAKALYWSARCFKKRGDPVRAKEMLAELKKLHPDSPWASKGLDVQPAAKPAAKVKAKVEAKPAAKPAAKAKAKPAAKAKPNK